jgi:hypothetical protein
MLNQQQNVKQEKQDYKITREELKKFDKFKNYSETELDAIRDTMYQYALILLKTKCYE